MKENVYVLAALFPGKQLPVSIKLDVGSATAAAWMLCRRENIFPPEGNRARILLV
jgi:hypothetical protein